MAGEQMTVVREAVRERRAVVAAFIADPARVTAAQVDRWCSDFDNWGICDTVCFKLFDRTPHAFRKVAQWSERKDEFGKRAAFARLACLALHDESSSDERNFVKKAVSWALRVIGNRSFALHAASLSVARRLAEAVESAARARVS